MFAFGAMIFWSIGDFLVQRITKAIGSFEALAWVNLVGGLGLLPFVVSDLEKLNSWQTLTPLLFLGVLDFVFGLMIYKAYERGKLSVVEVVMIIELPFTILLGVFFFQERLTLIQIILVALILAGVMLVSQGRQGILRKLMWAATGRGRLIEKGALLAAAAALLSALYNFLIAMNAREVAPVMAIWFPWVMGLILLLGYIFYDRGAKKFIADGLKHKKLILSGAMIETAAWVFFAFALTKKELSVTTAITESYPALALFLGVKFNNEKITGLQYSGAMLALAASIGMAFVS